MKVAQVIRDSNRDVGGRVVEMAETEYMVRGKGYLRGRDDIEMLVVKAERGTPGAGARHRAGRAGAGRTPRADRTERRRRSGLRHRHGPLRRERTGSHPQPQNPKIAEIGPGLPPGVTVQTVYDRSELIQRAIETLKGTLIEESIIVALVCVVFLMHVRSALVAILMLPVGVLMAFIAMHLLGMSSNLMSLGGIAIAIGAMIDAAIVMIENAHKHLERLPESATHAGPPGSHAHRLPRKSARPCSSRS
jgi:Cu(I)/Ag(I) efflux system membrane protein CusA/SilA